ncbi:hypothetical protein F5Y04DRAFT_255901 [Hypomontagnella monticulosa]|nr:hypothetical protein F5Y04DRAFT_255901 [Hypomontagnella monticulosa]
MEDERGELSKLWNEAVDEYSRKTKRVFDAGNLGAKVSGSDELDALIEGHQLKFSDFRNAHGRLFGVFLSTMKRLRDLSEIARAGIGLTPFAPASTIIEAACFLIDAGSAVADTYDSLEKLFRRIQDITDRLEEYLEGTVDDKLHRLMVNLLCSVLEVFGEAEGSIRRGRGKEMMRRVVGRENKVQTALDRLDQMWQTELGLITAKIYAATQRIDENVGMGIDQTLLDQALSASVALDMEKLHTELEESRLTQSGEWLLEEQLFRRWTQMNFPVLWVLGKPGTGKTYLASRVITYLRESQSHLGHGGVGYFYIRESMQTQYNPSTILTSISNQITKTYNEYRKAATVVCRDGNGLLSPNRIWNALFVEFFSKATSRPIFIIIDGMDESLPEHQNFLLMIAQQLSKLRVQSKYPLIQILFLGRPELEYGISNIWTKAPKVIQLEPSKSQADIKRFIRKGVENIGLLNRIRRVNKRQAKALRDEIIVKLDQAANGMFLLAKLMLTEIKGMNKPELIREALNCPPKGLGDMFKRVIKRLVATGGFDKQDLNEVIIWVVCAKRDLYLEEIDSIIKLRDPNQNGIYALEDELRTRFGSFFTVGSIEIDDDDKDDDKSIYEGQENEEDENGKEDTNADDWAGLGDESSRDNIDGESDILPSFPPATTVRFSHTSVGQHFRTQSLYEGIGILDLNSARVHILETCLRFLTHKNLETDKYPYSWGLEQYLKTHFLEHLIEVDVKALKGSQPGRFTEISRSIFFLFRNEKAHISWLDRVWTRRQLLFYKKDICSCIQEWIPECTAPNQFSRSETRWLRHVKVMPQAIFKPLAKSIATRCLGRNNLFFLEDVAFLDECISLNAQSQPRRVLSPNPSIRQIVGSIPPKQIRQLASFGQVKRSLIWHMRLSSEFRRIGTPRHYLEAARECRRARRKYGGSWEVYCGEARALYNLGLYRETIKAASFAIQYEPPIGAIHRLEILDLIRKSKLALMEFEAAISVANEASMFAIGAEDRSIWDLTKATFNMIQTFNEAHRFSSSVDYIKSILAKDKTSGIDLFGTIICVHERAGENIITACVESGQLDFARDAFAAVTAVAERSGDSLRAASTRYELARLYFRYYRDDEKAVQLWESIAKNHPDAAPGCLASSALAPLYYTKATETNENRKSWISKLRKLTRQEDNTKGVVLWDVILCSFGISALLGRWHIEQGGTEEAYLFIRPSIKDSTHFLANDGFPDDHNIHATYEQIQRLAGLLLSFGDRANAEVAWAFNAPFQKSKELQDIEELCQNGIDPTVAEDLVESTYQRDGASTLEKISNSRTIRRKTEPFRIHRPCEGLCRRKDVYFRSFSVCEICNNVSFCDLCLQKLKAGTLPFRICNPKHPFIEIYPPKGLVAKVDGGYKVQRNGEWINAEEWFDTIRRQWLSE